jgi:hypothetical protein
VRVGVFEGQRDPPRNDEEPGRVGEEEAIEVIEIKDESEDEEGQAEDGEEEKEDEEVAAPGPGVLPISAPGGDDATPARWCITWIECRSKAGKDAWKAFQHVTGPRGGAYQPLQHGYFPTKEDALRAEADYIAPECPGPSALVGVSYCKRRRKWRSFGGYYNTEEEAGLAYDRREVKRKLNVCTDDVNAAGSGFVEDGSGSGHLQGGRQAAGVAGGGGHRSRSKSPKRRRDRDQSRSRDHLGNSLAKRHRGPGKSNAGDAGAMAEGATEATRMSTKAAATEEDKQREHEVRVAAPKTINEAVAVREAEAQAARDAAAAEAQAARDAAAAAAAAAQYAATEKDKQGDAAAAAAATAMSLAAGGSGVAALAQAHAALEAHLVGVHPGLVNYIDVLVKLGVDTVNDLGKLDEEDIESLELKKWHQAEFMRACGK